SPMISYASSTLDALDKSLPERLSGGTDYGRGAWRAEFQSAPWRRSDLLSRLIEHHYPPAQIPVNRLRLQPGRRAVIHRPDRQHGINQRLIVSVGNLQSHECAGLILDPGEKRRLSAIDRRPFGGRNQCKRRGGLALGGADEVTQDGQGKTR